MKNIYKIIVVIGVVILSYGCTKDFLETEPTNQISSVQIERASKLSPELQESNIAGLYTIMYSVESGGLRGNQTDFGQKGLDIYTDMITGDMVLSGLTYGWYGDMAEYKITTDFTDNGNYMPWRYYYRIIFAANNVINAIGGEDMKFEKDEKSILSKHYMGQALAMRGYAYLYLATLFAPEYNPDADLVPIYRTSKDIDKPKAKMKEVLDLAISDLSKAAEHLSDFTRSKKSEVNKYVAEGLLAYAYGYVGNYDKVKTLTKDIIDNGGFVKMGKSEIVYAGDPNVGGFKSVESPGWMWGLDVTLDLGLDLISWWGQVDAFSYSYAAVGDGKVISEGLYDKIRNDDIRKGQFTTNPSFKLYPINKFYPGERKVMGQRNITTDYVYMRVSEMLLLHAESLAKTGDNAGAKKALKDFLADRITDLSYIDGLDGKALLKEIYLQTRIELWGEGKSIFALRRSKEDVVLGKNHLYFAGKVLKYNANELYYKIPQNEVINNPKIKE